MHQLVGFPRTGSDRRAVSRLRGLIVWVFCFFTLGNVVSANRNAKWWSVCPSVRSISCSNESRNQRFEPNGIRVVLPLAGIKWWASCLALISLEEPHAVILPNFTRWTAKFFVSTKTGLFRFACTVVSAG